MLLRLSLAEFHFVSVSGPRVTLQPRQRRREREVSLCQRIAAVCNNNNYNNLPGRDREWFSAWGERNEKGILRTYICPLSHSGAALNCLVLLTLLLPLSGPPGGNFHVEMMHDGLNRLASASAAANWLANCAKTVASSNQIWRINECLHFCGKFV